MIKWLSGKSLNENAQLKSECGMYTVTGYKTGVMVEYLTGYLPRGAGGIFGMIEECKDWAENHKKHHYVQMELGWDLTTQTSE